MKQINLYRVNAKANRYDTVNDLMIDVRAADSYQDAPSAQLDLSLIVAELKPGHGVLVWVSEEGEDS